MMKIDRPAPPMWLAQNWELWGQEFEQKRQETPGHDPMRRRYQGREVRHHLIELLLEITKKHCSFCDSFPLVSQIREMIEHFRPKSVYPRLAYQWENLFACCGRCQDAKGDRFNESLLKPDDIEYEFRRYFFFDKITGKIIPNPGAVSEDQTRAEVTIRLYKLNDFNRPEARLWALEIARQCPTLPLDKHSYRFMFL
jgi:uncharacterized protein (TIGR02646 family)